MTGYASSTALSSAYDLNSASVWAAVQFDESADYSTSLPAHVIYSLRVAIFAQAEKKKWFTKRAYEFFQRTGYRNNLSTGGDPCESYFYFCNEINYMVYILTSPK